MLVAVGLIPDEPGLLAFRLVLFVGLGLFAIASRQGYGYKRKK